MARLELAKTWHRQRCHRGLRWLWYQDPNAVSATGENWFWHSCVRLVGEQDAEAEQVRTGAAVHLAFEHLDAVDVSFDATGAPPECQPGGDGVLVGAGR
jgi:hypothetical protein